MPATSSQLQASRNCKKATAARNLGTTGAEIAAAMAAKGRTELEVGADGVAVITICNPPVNSLSIDGMVLRCALYSPKSALLIFPIFLVGWLVRDWSFRSAELLNSTRGDVKLLPLCQLLQPLCLILSSVICMIRDWGFWGTGSWGTVESFSITVLLVESECFGLGLALG